MSTVLDQIEQQIAKLSTKAVKKNTGNIRTIADGVAKIDGLSDVMYNEMVAFPGGAIGIALNLEESEVGCVILGDVSKLKEGDEVQTTGKLLSVPVGKALLGRAVDALGNPLDGIATEGSVFIQSPETDPANVWRDIPAYGFHCPLLRCSCAISQPPSGCLANSRVPRPPPLTSAPRAMPDHAKL